MGEERSADTSARPGMIVRIFQLAVLHITNYEVEKDLKKLKAGKAAGLDGVATEYLKLGWNV